MTVNAYNWKRQWHWMVMDDVILIAWSWCSMWFYSLVECIIDLSYCCCTNLIDVPIPLSLQRSIDVAATTTEVCGPSWVTIVDALFDYDCCFAFLWLSNCT